MVEETKYAVGIDVGTNSIGFAAIELNDDGAPVQLLNSMALIHDSGVDPEQAKAAVTRLASAGVARRARRLVARRRKRLQKLDEFMESLGWPLHDPNDFTNPYFQWELRAKLAEERLEGEEQLSALSIALRHMARHRGWRSPYARVETLHIQEPDSKLFVAMKERIKDRFGIEFEEGVTPAQVVVQTGLSPAVRWRSAPSNKYGDTSVKDGRSVAGEAKEGLLGGKLMQSDNANEIRKIGEVQGLGEDLVNQLIDKVFQSESPIGSSTKKVKKDTLPGQGAFPRAPKAHPEFQKFRIVSVVANLRIKDGDARTRRELTPEEKSTIIDFLMNADGSDGITWADVAEQIGLNRADLYGTATLSAEGERPSSFPPTNTTNRKILGSKIKPLVNWWKEASDDEKAAMVIALSNADVLPDDAPGAEAAKEFLTTLTDVELGKLDELSLPAGRAAYSVETLKRLSERMFSDSVDLHEARKREFGVDDEWAPPTDPIGELVGNPAVDRVLKAVNRWLLAAQREWGAPFRINIEHVRNGFSSEFQVREYERELKKRRERNEKVVAEANEALGGNREFRRSDLTRYISVRRQNCQCVYCGDIISYETCEMDHIVPRKGPGSTNTRNNLVAVCIRCNRAKSNIPFAVWADKAGIAGVSVKEAMSRVRHWIPDEGLTAKQNRNFQNDVIDRLLKRTEDDEIDNRSIESVAWMANELHRRIEGHFKRSGDDVDVSVYQGAITAEARKAAGIENKINLIGGRGKTRFDRRHHAVDAAVIAMMRPSVAKTLKERISIRQSQRLTGEHETWKNYSGADYAAKELYARWLDWMDGLLVLINIALANKEIPVTQNVRLRLGDGAAHDATIRKWNTKQLGDSWTLDQIDRASSEQMWVALTRCPDFDPEEGLPENPDRKIRVKNDWFEAGDELNVFPKKIAGIAVRGGYAEIGNSIHHARVYKLPGKKPKYGMIRVFANDLLQHRDKDLFTVPLRPSCISLRTAKDDVRKAVVDGTAEYLGWLVAGAELELELRNPKFQKFAIGELLNDFPDTTSWVVNGFMTPSKVTLRPRILSSEGLGRVMHSRGSEKIIGSRGTGWVVELQALFNSEVVRVIWRDSLGRMRFESVASLPQVATFKGD